jgi:hypothetical protein
VVVEDVHWADDATLDVLRYLGRRVEDLPAVLVVTYRDDEVGPAHPLQRVPGALGGPRYTGSGSGGFPVRPWPGRPEARP